MTTPHIVPVILTCARDLEATRRFAASFQHVKHGMAHPIVVIDESQPGACAGEHRGLVATLDPAIVHVHPPEPGLSAYDSVQWAAHFALARALEGTAPGDRILFLEDDVIFAASFVDRLHAIRIDDDTGFITLYLPGHGYGGPEVNPGHFYGTQCLLFPRWAVEAIVAHVEFVHATFPPGYDIRWSRYLAHLGYKLWQTDVSLVQHDPARSRLHGSSSHCSFVFAG